MEVRELIVKETEEKMNFIGSTTSETQPLVARLRENERLIRDSIGHSSNLIKLNLGNVLLFITIYHYY